MSITLHIHPTRETANKKVAREIAELIRAKPHAVLGLATGATPIGVYEEMVRLHHQEGLSFRQVCTFNLDEYQGIDVSHPESYWNFMHRHLFDHIDIPAANIHIPGTRVPSLELAEYCKHYEELITVHGGIDYQILGIGRTGHIGFNEPGSPPNCRTRRVLLDGLTREDAAPAFGDLDHVPTHAITMGCGTIMEAKRVALLAFGAAKAAIVRKALRGPVSDQVSASYLQNHDHTSFHLDHESAPLL